MPIDEVANAVSVLQQVLALPGEESAVRLLSAEAAAAAQVLTRAVDASSDDSRLALVVSHVLGWWHELVSELAADAQDRTEHQNQATILLERIYRVAPELVPPRVRKQLAEMVSQLNDRAVDALRRIMQGRPGVSLDETLRALQLVVDSTPDSDPNRAIYLSNIGNALAIRFEHTGHLADLDEAIRLGREVVEATPDGQHGRAMHLSNLGISMRTRYNRTGQVADLDEAIEFGREAVEATLDGQPDRAMYLSNLGNALIARFERAGQLADLDEAIEFGREAVEATLDGQPGRAAMLSNLGNALRTRFGRTGRAADLDEAIKCGREAVKTTPDHHPDRAGMMSNLGNAFALRFGRTGQLADLDDAILRDREAVEATPEGHPDQAKRLSNLGVALQTRFRRTRRLADLDEAIKFGREAVEGTPEDHTERARHLSNLGAALLARFGQTGRLEDLEDAIQIVREAVQAAPEDHTERARHLSNLGAALLARFEKTGEDGDRAGAVACFQEAAGSRGAAPATACGAAAAWGRLLSGPQAVEAFETALGLLPRVSGRWLGFEDALAQGRSLSRVGRDAAAAFIDAGHPGRALVAVEQAGAVTFSRMLQSRSDLTELRAVREDLAERVGAALAVLNADERQTAAQLATTEGRGSRLAVDRVGAARRAADAALEEALSEVRGLGGRWDRFFLPPLVEDLTRAATAGPIVVLNVASRRCDALVVTTTDVQVVHLPALSEEQAIEHANQFLTDLNILSSQKMTTQQRTAADQRMGELCAWMWDTITGPVMDHLGHTDPTPGGDYRAWPRVWWIATGPLAILPIHAAGHHPHTPDTAGGPAVIDRVVSSTLPTIGSLIASQEADHDYPEKALLVGMPQTPPVNGQPVADLPGVTAELGAISRRLNNTPTLSLIQGRADVAAPTKPRLRAELPRHGWAHLACHTLTDPANPTASALLLTDHPDDPFTVLDLTSTASAGGQLLFLSACTTARTGLRDLDEPVHFAAAALLAGYRHVIATLWALQDATATELAESIYTDLTRDGHPHPWTADHAAAAVHQAARDQRATPATPIHAWATITHHGP